jgi:hypothetical protein
MRRAILYSGLILLLIFGFAGVKIYQQYRAITTTSNLFPGPGTRALEQPSRGNPDCNSQLDRDCDGISDELEHWLVEKYKPLLSFDDGEMADLNQTATIYQVSPIYLDDDDPQFDAVLITLMVLYPEDYGVQDINSGGLEYHFSCDYLGSGISRLADSLFEVGESAHFGDAETVKLFVNMDGDSEEEWFLEGAFLRQHAAPWNWYRAEQLERMVPGAQIPLEHTFVFYVAQGKHGIYPSERICEGADFQINLGIINSTCRVRLENCNGGELLYPETPASHNVGERHHPIEVFQESEILWELFPGESAWIDQPFCGGNIKVREDLPVINLGPDCTDAIAKKWDPGVVFD